MTFQEKLKLKISKIEHVNIVFYGDSITESLIGTAYDSPCSIDNKRCRDIPEVSTQSFFLMHRLGLFLYNKLYTLYAVFILF
jgi:hypothetical protein